MSFSIEFASFPDFAGTSQGATYVASLRTIKAELLTNQSAGNLSNPNTFSYNLLSNLGTLQGSYPIIRVGGNTQ